jgi:hypothetical protein
MSCNSGKPLQSGGAGAADFVKSVVGDVGAQSAGVGNTIKMAQAGGRRSRRRRARKGMFGMSQLFSKKMRGGRRSRRSSRFRRSRRYK